MNDWNPEHYLKFNKERIQPSIDLVSRINLKEPKRIIDIGCGPGNSTQILKQKWANSEIVGIDNSPAMIEKAKSDYPDQNWILLDAGNDEIPGKFDLVYSNATIQWIPEHYKLLKKFKELLNDNGVLAIQVPLFLDMPIRQAISQVSRMEAWKNKTNNVDSVFTIHSYQTYYDYLSELFSGTEMWKCSYMHIMESHQAILDMIKSTGLKPYLEKLENEEEKQHFVTQVLEITKEKYPLQKNGKVIFPFERLFFTATR
jgi:trans-aconitate 2-methyltransferase